METLLHGIVSVGLFLGSLLGIYSPPQETPLALGAEVQPIAGVTYTLSGSGVSASASSIILSSLTIPQTGQKIQDSDLSSTFYVTLEPGNRTRQELVSCTTVTQNANDTATLSGCSRGLAPITPYTASSTLQFAHAGGTQVIFSNPPQLYNQFAAKSNNETITGQWTFDTFPLSASNSTSSVNVAGVSQLATGAQIAASTATSTNGTVAPLVIPASLATSTYNSATAGNVIPVTDSTLKTIDDDFLPATTTKPLEFASTTYIGDFYAWHIGKQMQVITTTGTSTFTVPSGITKINVTTVGGGGTGGACSVAGSAAAAGGGGGGGGTAIENIDVSATTSIQVFVGATDEPSKFGTNGFYHSATAGTAGASEGGGGGGGTGVGGDLNIVGQGGAGGQTEGSTRGAQSGSGGSSTMGGGGAGVTFNANGGVGGNYGGGGAGGACDNSATQGGGAGAQGIIIVRW